MATNKEIDKNLPTNRQVAQFELLSPLLKSVLFEVKELSKKKQDENLNKLKVGIINKILSQIKTEILNNDPLIEFLDLLDNETLPTNSDAVLIIAQYDAAMSQFRDKYHGWDGINQRWFTKENPGSKR